MARALWGVVAKCNTGYRLRAASLEESLDVLIHVNGSWPLVGCQSMDLGCMVGVLTGETQRALADISLARPPSAPHQPVFPGSDLVFTVPVFGQALD